MIRLVIRFVAGDGYTYSCTVTLPIEYDSPEAAAVDFEKVTKDTEQQLLQLNPRRARDAYFKFANVEFNICHFFENGVYCQPEFLTIDEWFAQPV